MFNKKNHIGRPTNEELRNRKIKKIALYGVPAILIIALITLVSTGSLSKLMGNSVTSYYCENSEYELEGTNCVKNLEMAPALLGDTDSDGVISVQDYDLLSKYIDLEYEDEDTNVLSDFQKLAADIDRDGEISYRDLSILRDYLDSAVSTYNIYYEKIGIDQNCPKDYTLSENKCIKKDIIPALIKNNEESKNDNKEMYTVSFDANGGTGTMEDVSFDPAENAKLPKNTYTNGSKKFLGWEALNKTQNQWICYNVKKVTDDYSLKSSCEYGKYVFSNQSELGDYFAKAGDKVVLYARWSDDQGDTDSPESPEVEPPVEPETTDYASVRLQTDFSGTTANKGDVINVIPTFTVVGQNQYYYIWKTYAYGRENYKSGCQEVTPGSLPAKTLSMFAERQGGIQIYSDSSCTAKVGPEVRTNKIPCKGCSPVFATFDKHENTEYKKDTWVYNKLTISVDDTSKQYYYIWQTYFNGKFNYKSDCQKVYPDVVQNKGLHMKGTRSGEVIIYSDSSCKKQVDKLKTQKFTVCSNCDNVDDEDIIELVPSSSSSSSSGSSSSSSSGSSSGSSFSISGEDDYVGDDYVIDDGADIIVDDGDNLFIDDDTSGNDTNGSNNSSGSSNSSNNPKNKTCTKWECPSGYTEWSGACRKAVSKTSYAKKVCTQTNCPSGYKLEAGVCRKEITKNVHVEKLCTNAVCPSGYTREAGVCRKAVTKTSHTNKTCAKYKCPSGYDEWSGTCRKEVTKTEHKAKQCTKEVCPRGYSYKEGTCRKAVTKTDHKAKECAKKVCPSGYNYEAGVCRKAVTKYQTTGTVCKEYKCPSGYSSWQGACRKAVTKTRHSNKTCASYKCPSGYTYTGGVCRKGNKATGKVCSSYKCPSGYTMKGGECLQNYTTYDVTSKKTCSQTGCPSGYTYSAGFCRKAYTDYDVTSKKTCVKTGCPSGYTYTGGTCRKAYTAYETTSKMNCQSYKCPSGYTEKAGECFKNYTTYEKTSKKCQSYECPSGYTEKGGECFKTYKTYDISSKKVCQSYKCPSGYTEKAGECFKNYTTYDVTSKFVCKAYKCPEGTESHGGECFKTSKAYSITSNFTCKAYKCPQGTESHGGECFKTYQAYDIRSKTCKKYE